MLDGMKAWAFREHPAGEDALNLAGKLHLIDLHEGRSMGCLGRRTGVAHPWGHLERAEFHRLVDRDLEMRDAPGDLVERGELGDWILDDLGVGDIHNKTRHERKGSGDQANRAGRAVSAKICRLHRAAHLLNGPVDDRSGALLKHHTPRP
jgi:hypothetical protein